MQNNASRRDIIGFSVGKKNDREPHPECFIDLLEFLSEKQTTSPFVDVLLVLIYDAQKLTKEKK